MATSLETLIASGTKLWLDSIDPDLVQTNRALGATGATSNPVIVGDLLKTGRFDDEMLSLGKAASDNESDEETIAWQMTDRLVANAQEVFQPVWEATAGNDGYVSFELDPLIEDVARNMPHKERVQQYIELGKKWSAGHTNRMIKVPATPAGIESLEHLCAAGITLNVTLIFTLQQYEAARDSVWRGAQRRADLSSFKSVYSVFVSRVDAYAAKEIPSLSDEAMATLGIVNAKRIWQANQEFWNANATPLDQEIVFASTGTKNPDDPAWKYVEALAGSDIQTNPPKTNDLTQASNRTISANIQSLPAAAVLEEIDAKVDFEKLGAALMEQGVQKFADPHRHLLALISAKKDELMGTK